MPRPRSSWSLAALAVAALAWSGGCVSTGARPVAVGDGASGVRRTAVAGSFYPSEARALSAALDGFLADAIPAAGPTPPVAIVAPHAGYIFSGQIAADAWNQAAGHDYEAIILLGTNHTGLSAGRVALFDGAALDTPIGGVPVDAGLTAALLEACGDCAADRAPHAREHSIEVHLPFVRRLFPGLPVVAAIVPPADPGLAERFGRTLAAVVGDRKALVVASSDLSHYPDARRAVEADRRTLQAILAMDTGRFKAATSTDGERGLGGLVTSACGEAPILAAIAAARAMGATRSLAVSYAHSGEVPGGDPGRVVGYGAVAFTTGEPGADDSGLPGTVQAAAGPLGEADRASLLALARRTIARYVESGTLPFARGLSAAAAREQGVFVTLRKHGQLRGCVGQVQPSGRLPRTVQEMALAAAFADRRFPKVKAGELKDIEVEISLLSPLAPVASLERILPGRVGVALLKDKKSAIFLPEVAAEQGWGRDELLENLCAKAELAAGCWRTGASLWTFETEVIAEKRH